MLHTRDAISFRRARPVFHSAVLAVLTMAAMLLCLLAVHSAGTGHGPGHGLTAALASATATATVTATAMTPTAATAAAAHAAHTASSVAAVPDAMLDRVASVAVPMAVPMAVPVAALEVGTISGVDAHALSGMVALSMTCTFLIVLGGLIALSRRPSTFRRLLEAGGFTVGSFREIPLHLHRPSLTLLSISRI